MLLSFVSFSLAPFYILPPRPLPLTRHEAARRRDEPPGPHGLAGARAHASEPPDSRTRFGGECRRSNAKVRVHEMVASFIFEFGFLDLYSSVASFSLRGSNLKYSYVYVEFIFCLFPFLNFICTCVTFCFFFSFLLCSTVEMATRWRCV